MIIRRPSITESGGVVKYTVVVESSQGTRELWFSVDEKFGDMLSLSCDPALLGLLIPAMAVGEDIYVEGPVSERLWLNLSRAYQKLLRLVNPGLRAIKIYPTHLENSRGSGRGVLTGFSGGVDSFCTLADYYYSDIPPGLKITHLLFSNVGSHGREPRGNRLFEERFRLLLPVTERIGLPFIQVNSNLGSFYEHPLSFEQTHSARNTSVALLLSNGVAQFLYSSAYSFKDVFVGPTKYIAYTDPIGMPLLSTEALNTTSVGSEYTRVEKTLRVAEVRDSYDSLNVCVREARNCSSCWKCLRTLLTLEIGGVIDRYSNAFDLTTYRRNRTRFIGQVLGSTEPLLREIRDFAVEKEFLFPFGSRLYGMIYRPYSYLRRVFEEPARSLRKKVIRARVAS